MRRILILLAVACLTLMSVKAFDLYDKYYFELGFGQKWNFEVTDHDTGLKSVATVTFGGDTVVTYKDANRNEVSMGCFVVDVEFDNDLREKYAISAMNFISDELRVFSDNKKEFVTVFDCDVPEGENCTVFSNETESNSVDYIFVAGRARKRTQLKDEGNDCDRYYVGGVGFDSFEVRTGDWGHNRTYRLVRTEWPDGSEFVADDFGVPTLVPDNKYYIDGDRIVYSGRTLSYDMDFDVEYRVVGDTQLFGVPCKKIECWSLGEKMFEFEIFDINKQVYRTHVSDFSSFKPYVLYNLEIGDSMMEGYEEASVSEVKEVEISGESRRAIKFKEVDLDGIDSLYGYWVEGVGPNTAEGFNNIWLWTTRLEGIYRDGECLFNYSSLFDNVGVEELRDMEEIDCSDGTKSSLYNLLGIPIDRPVPGQPYITAGRLVMP